MDPFHEAASSPKANTTSFIEPWSPETAVATLLLQVHQLLKEFPTLLQPSLATLWRLTTAPSRTTILLRNIPAVQCSPRHFCACAWGPHTREILAVRKPTWNTCTVLYYLRTLPRMTLPQWWPEQQIDRQCLAIIAKGPAATTATSAAHGIRRRGQPARLLRRLSPGVVLQHQPKKSLMKFNWALPPPAPTPPPPALLNPADLPPPLAIKPAIKPQPCLSYEWKIQFSFKTQEQFKIFGRFRRVVINFTTYQHGAAHRSAPGRSQWQADPHLGISPPYHLFFWPAPGGWTQKNTASPRKNSSPWKKQVLFADPTRLGRPRCTW